MLRLLFIGFVGATSAIGGLWLNELRQQRAHESEVTGLTDNKPLQVKTEITGVPVVKDGQVAGYVVFQISSTVDGSKLDTPELNVSPYILDAAIRASYMSTEDGSMQFDAPFIQRLSDLIVKETNAKLKGDVVRSVNVEQFNFVPKDDIRGSIHTGAKK